MKPILTIYQASNDTSALYFEDEDDAQKYAGSAGIASGISVCPVAIVQSSRAAASKVIDREPQSMTTYSTMVRKINSEAMAASKPDYSNPKTRPEGYYIIETAFNVSSIAYWSGDAWLCHGDENEYFDNELNLKSVEFVELKPKQC